MIDLNNLGTFVKVVEKGSFTAAANDLYISQPAVSKRIETLETELGIVLFLRENHKVILTEAGKLLYEKASVSIDSINDVISRIQQTKKPFREITISYDASGTLSYVKDMLPDFTRICPEAVIKLQHSSFEDSRNDIFTGKTDIMFDALPEGTPIDPRFRYTKLKEDNTCLLVRSDHRLAGRKTVSIQELHNETLIVFNDNFPNNWPKELHGCKVIKCQSFTMIADMVLMGLGVTTWIYSLDCNDTHLKKVSLDPALKVHLYAVTSRKPSNLTKKLLKILEKKFESS